MNYSHQPVMGPQPPPTIRPLPSPRKDSFAASDFLYINAVYYPNYRVYRGETPASLPIRCISHVFYAFAKVGQDGGVYLSDEYADAQMDVDDSLGCLGSLAAIKRRTPFVKVILSVGGGGCGSENFPVIAASAALRDNFGRSARGLVTASGLDGIDVDWEHPADEEQGRNFLSLLAAVRLHLPEEEYLLTAALPAGQWALRHIDLAKTQDYLDFINLMAYDFSGPWSPRAGHQAQLYAGDSSEASGSAAVNYVLSTGFPSKKILLGIPAYGRSFLGARVPGDRYEGQGGEDGTFEYKSLPRPGTKENVDPRRVAASCAGGEGGFVSYDNAETVEMKARFCRSHHLGGLFYWTGTADASGPRSLVGAGFRALHS